jgi:hypothetical protein
MATYIKGVNIKKGKTDFFKLLFSGKSETFIEEIKKYTNEKGYFNFEITERRDEGKYGETHSLKLNEWKPKEKDEDFI